MADFVIEHQCPQCGAPAELAEADRLLACPYCRVKSYLTTDGVFRYIIPHHAPEGRELIYYPYWRFKGMLFSCLGNKIDNRFIDASRQALISSVFPFNIGFRAQTQKLRFAAVETKGVFLKPDVSYERFFAGLLEHYTPASARSILHQEFIGETRSLIYSPFYFDPKLVDAVVNEPVSGVCLEDIPEGLFQADLPMPPIQFLAALCPKCGWDLSGEQDCLVLNCENCRSAWWEKNGKFTELKTAHLPAEGDDWVYLPFWRIQADITPIRLKSYADLVKTANLPKVQQPGWDKIPFRFWNPAFKVHPQNYLTIASHVTMNPPPQETTTGPPDGAALRVSLPLKEAVETLKLNVAKIIHPVERRAELLPKIQITANRFLLVYIPFKDTRLEFVQPRLNLAVNKNALLHAQNL